VVADTCLSLLNRVFLACQAVRDARVLKCFVVAMPAEFQRYSRWN
jgi:hypothetical protein